MTPILPSRREGQAHTAGHPPSPFPLAQQPAAAKAWFRAPAPARRISGAAEPSGRRLRPWAKWVDSGSSGPWGRKQSHHAADALIRNLQLPGLWDHKALSLRALRGGTLLGQPWETNKHRGIGKGEKAPCIQVLGQGTSDVGHRGQGTCAPNPDPCVILSAPVLGSETLKRPLFPRKGPQLV